jgi:hypothetical protein
MGEERWWLENKRKASGSKNKRKARALSVTKTSNTPFLKT